MKVLLVNASDIEGGAARGALRLMHGVRAAGVDARLLVQRKSGDDPLVAGPEGGFAKAMSYARPVLEELYLGAAAPRRRGIFSPALLPDRLAQRVELLDPRLVHLHWVGNGMMRAETLGRLGRPVVWTLHDSWAFTGGCHLPGECLGYRAGCGNCPVLGSGRERDLSRRVLRRKGKGWRGADLTVVAPSRWLARCAETSSLFAEVRVEVIPNGIDTGRFRPLEKRLAREILGLPQDRKLVLFGGKWITSDRNKGFHFLTEALARLGAQGWDKAAQLVVYGAAEPADPPCLGLEAHYLGWLHDDVSLALVNAAADVFVSPSIQENLSYAVLEALSCGTPCVAFDQGGMPDLVEHCANGYLARPYDPAELAQGIAWVLGDAERHGQLALRAREKVLAEFAMEKVAQRYAELYREVVARGASRR